MVIGRGVHRAAVKWTPWTEKRRVLETEMISKTIDGSDFLES